MGTAIRPAPATWPRLVPAVATVALSLACGGSSSITIKGQTWLPHDEISGVAPLSTTTSTGTAAEIFIVSGSNLCANMAANQAQKNLEGMVFVIVDVNTSTGATTAPTAPGTYPISSSSSIPSGQSKVSFADFSASDASCKMISSDFTIGISGNITLTRVQGTAYSGTYNIAFDSGDRVAGSFTATGCNLGNVNHPTCI